MYLYGTSSVTHVFFCPYMGFIVPIWGFIWPDPWDGATARNAKSAKSVSLATAAKCEIIVKNMWLLGVRSAKTLVKSSAHQVRAKA